MTASAPSGAAPTPARRLAERFLGLVAHLNTLVGWLLALALGAMTVLITWQVFARFVLSNSLTFSEEIARFLMIWLSMLGTAYALRQGSLLSVDLLPELLKGRARLWLMVAANVVSTVFYVVLIVYGWNMAQQVAYQRAPATGLSMFWPMLALSVGGLLCVVNTVAVIVEDFLQGGAPAPHEHMLAEAEG